MTDIDSRDAKSRPEPWEPGSHPGAGDSPSRLALPANCPFRRCILRVTKKGPWVIKTCTIPASCVLQLLVGFMFWRRTMLCSYVSSSSEAVSLCILGPRLSYDPIQSHYCYRHEKTISGFLNWLYVRNKDIDQASKVSSWDKFRFLGSDISWSSWTFSDWKKTNGTFLGYDSYF